MDKEYIDKNEILYQMSMGLIPQDYEWTRAYALARKLIKDAPAEDVEPVVHGEWIPIINYFHGKPDGRYYCSVCRRVENTKGIYCRMCGARMDGGKKE
jgi:hypothetical protein